MDADAEFDAALGRHAGVALDEAVLHLDGAAHRVDHAAKLDQAAVAGALDDAPVMCGDGGIDEIAAQPPEPRKGAILVRAGKTAVADDIRDQDRCNFLGSRHSGPSATMQNSTKTRPNPPVSCWRSARRGRPQAKGLRFDPLATPSGNDCYLRAP